MLLFLVYPSLRLCSHETRRRLICVNLSGIIILQRRACLNLIDALRACHAPRAERLFPHQQHSPSTHSQLSKPNCRWLDSLALYCDHLRTLCHKVPRIYCIPYSLLPCYREHSVSRLEYDGTRTFIDFRRVLCLDTYHGTSNGHARAGRLLGIQTDRPRGMAARSPRAHQRSLGPDRQQEVSRSSCLAAELLLRGLSIRIADPFLGFNELQCEWVGEQSWTYRRALPSVPKTEQGQVHVLAFDGLDTFATVKLNGTVILESDNMWIPHRVDVTSIIGSRQDNLLEIEFKSALLEARRIKDARPEHKWVGFNGEMARLAVRKAQYHWCVHLARVSSRAMADRGSGAGTGDHFS